MNRILDSNRTEGLQPPPNLHPQIRGLGRELVNEQQPAQNQRSLDSSIHPKYHVSGGDRMTKHLYQNNLKRAMDGTVPDPAAFVAGLWVGCRSRSRQRLGAALCGIWAARPRRFRGWCWRALVLAPPLSCERRQIMQAKRQTTAVHGAVTSRTLPLVLGIIAI